MFKKVLLVIHLHSKNSGIWIWDTIIYESTMFHGAHLRSEQPESSFFNSHSQKNTRRKQTPTLRPLLEVSIEICKHTYTSVITVSAYRNIPRQHPARWSSVKPQKVDVSAWLYSSINIREGKNQKPRELHYHKVMREPISADWKSHQLLRKSPASIDRSNFKTIAWEFPYLSTHDNILRQKTVDSKM